MSDNPLCPHCEVELVAPYRATTYVCRECDYETNPPIANQ